jgi:N-hydroxyarylamine O-acetyltransferase
MTLDLDAYLHRVGHTGPRHPTLDTLRALQLAHLQAIPFENLNPLLRWPVRLDLASLQGKIVRGGRGGYCYEHNLLLLAVLRTLGFEAGGLGARVVWGLPEDAVSPRTHMLLLVTIDEEPWIADVGFGGQTPSAPLRLREGLSQQTPHGAFRLRTIDGDWLLQAQVAGQWKGLYRFDLQPHHLADYEMASWYLTHHPDSHFLQGLIAALISPEGRWVLRNGELGLHRLDGTTQRRTLGDASAVHAALREVFRIEIEPTPEVMSALARLPFPPEGEDRADGRP